MNRALLEKPFEPAQIKQRQGRNGWLDYVEGHAVIQRLKEAFEGAWSFEVVSHEVRQYEVLVLGKLAAEGVAKMQFGASQVTREKASGLPVSLGDDLKAAATDALKKCASLLGVGLHLYAEKPIRQGAGKAASVSAKAEPKGAPASGQVTPRQLDAVARLARAKGLDPAAVESMSLRVFNRKPEALTQTEAARLIKELSNLKRNAA
jgi:hypothetical protein